MSGESCVDCSLNFNKHAKTCYTQIPQMVHKSVLARCDTGCHQCMAALVSGGLTPCWQLRPSSRREHVRIPDKQVLNLRKFQASVATGLIEINASRRRPGRPSKQSEQSEAK